MAESIEVANRHTTRNEVYVNCLIDTKNETWMAPSTLKHFDKGRKGNILPYKCIIRKFNRSKCNV